MGKELVLKLVELLEHSVIEGSVPCPFSALVIVQINFPRDVVQDHIGQADVIGDSLAFLFKGDITDTPEI